MDPKELSKRLIEKGLKVTPQRIAVLEAILTLKNHPTAENIIEYIRNNQPHIATATVYKVLDALVENRMIKKVKTETDIMRYDAEMDNHHHLYCSQSNRIEDYFNDELNKLLDDYFAAKRIKGFVIEDIKLQLIGRFTGIKPEGSAQDNK